MVFFVLAENLFSYVQSSSRLVLCLYAAWFAGRDILIGRHENIPLESQSGSFLIRNLARSASYTSRG